WSTDASALARSILFTGGLLCGGGTGGEDALCIPAAGAFVVEPFAQRFGLVVVVSDVFHPGDLNGAALRCDDVEPSLILPVDDAELSEIACSLLNAIITNADDEAGGADEHRQFLA